MKRPTSRMPTKHTGITRVEWPSGTVTYEARAPWWIDAEGRRNDPRKTFAKLADARTWRTEQLGLRAQGVRQATGRLTLGDYLDDWIEGYTARNPGNTAANYRRALAKLKPLTIWRAQLADVELEDVKRAYDALDARAVPYVHDPLHLALSDAVPRRLGRNPATGATKGRKVARAERAVWDEAEYRAWLAAAAGDELHALWRVLGQTGARRGELLGLDWPDVDLDGARLTIRRQFTVEAGTLKLKDVKTPRGRRTIDLDAGTVEIGRASCRERV